MCTECNGSRLTKASEHVKICGKSIGDLLQISLDDLDNFIQKLKLSSNEEQISERLLIEIKNRLKFIQNVGLGYLNLNRRSDTLSGGETQRIQLVTSLGSSLVGSMYILDEPSIGLHPRDNKRLIKVLEDLRDLGNTVIVVEHDEEIMSAADYIIDIGPEAGTNGGEIVASGSLKKILNSNGLTAEYLNGSKKIELPKKRRLSKSYIEIIGARENNLKNINVKFPLSALTVICGVSGSGKSSLVRKILYPALLRHLEIFVEKPGAFTEINGNLDNLKSVEYIDQKPIGRSSRSNPVTYVKAYDDIRALFCFP